MPVRMNYPTAMTDRDRRRAQRFQISSVRVEVDIDADPEALSLVDISISGFSVRARRAFDVAAVMHVTFTIDACLSLIVPARVVHCRMAPSRHQDGYYFAGFEFVHDQQPDIERIVDILIEAVAESPSVH